MFIPEAYSPQQSLHHACEGDIPFPDGASSCSLRWNRIAAFMIRATLRRCSSETRYFMGACDGSVYANKARVSFNSSTSCGSRVCPCWKCRSRSLPNCNASLTCPATSCSSRGSVTATADYPQKSIVLYDGVCRGCSSTWI